MQKVKGKIKNAVRLSPLNVNFLADDLLKDIGNLKGAIEVLECQGNVAMKMVVERHEKLLTPLKEDLAAQEKVLIALMKKERDLYFAETDVLQLQHGALIHEEGDHVKIPRDALEKCKELKFLDVIKKVESLDREAIEKWTDEKLLLIGAERKPVENFSYDLKKQTKGE